VNISQFFGAMETVKINIDKNHKITKDNIDYYPVYIVLFASNNFVSKSIRAVTRAEFSHVAISFDTSMTNLFSFGFRTNAKDMKDCGNRRESLIVKKDRWVYEDDTKYGVYVKFMTLNAINKMKKHIHYVYNNTDKYKFTFIGMVKYAFHIPSENTYKMFCSQFIASLFKIGGDKLDRVASLYSPEQILTIGDVHSVQTGLVKDFKRKELDANVQKLCESLE
jgi:hypothetical protein